MSRSAGILVIDDGDVAGLLGCASAAEANPTGSAVWADVGTGADGVDRDRAVRRHAEAYALEFIGAGQDLTRPGVQEGGFGATRLLVEAGLEAARRGIDRVVWCVHFGGRGPGDKTDLDAVAKACDRALLTTRLLSLDAPRDLRIETPYVDLSDVQVAELAADLDVSLEACWWARATGGDSVEAARSRWTRALEAAGLGDLLVRAGG